MNYTGDLEWLNTFKTEKITCPHCGWEDEDSWEQTESGIIYCSDCGEEFFVEREVDVKYTTKKQQQ